MFWVKKATAATIALFTMFAFGVGVGVSTFQMAPAADGQDNVAQAKSAVPAQTPDGSKAPAGELDLDKILADLQAQLEKMEKQHAVAEKLFKESVDQVKKVQLDVIIAKNQFQSVDSTELQKTLATNTQYKKELEDHNKKLDELKSLIAKMKIFKDQYEKDSKAREYKRTFSVENLVTPIQQTPASSDLDKQINELKKKQEELQLKLEVESLNSLVKQAFLKDELKKIQSEIATLVKQKELNPNKALPAKVASGYFQLAVETKAAEWPFVIFEYDPNGKLVGKTAFNNSVALGRFLARAMKDSTAPKEVRIIAQSNVPIETLTAVVEACKSAGITQSVKVGSAQEFGEWLHLAESNKNLSESDGEKRSAYLKTMNELYNKQVEQQKMVQDRNKQLEQDYYRQLEQQRMKQELERNNREAGQKALEWFQKQMKNETETPPKKP